MKDRTVTNLLHYSEQPYGPEYASKTYLLSYWFKKKYPYRQSWWERLWNKPVKYDTRTTRRAIRIQMSEHDASQFTQSNFWKQIVAGIDGPCDRWQLEEICWPTDYSTNWAATHGVSEVMP